MDKKKILFIMHMPPPVHGAAMMGKWIHDSEYINKEFDCLFINPTLSDNIKSVGKDGWRKSIMGLRKVWKIFRIAIKEKPDVCYYTATASINGCKRDALVVNVLKLAGRKVVLHLHNKGFKWRFEGFKTPRLLFPWVFDNNKVILISDKLYDDVDMLVKKENVLICPNGIPKSINYEPQAERYNKITRLFFLSNLIESKGVIILLDAIKILKEKGISISCDFVGAESEDINKGRFDKEVQDRGIENMVAYHGKKYGEEKQQFFQSADIFVFPTFYPGETFGLVNLEAMEYKLPVITTDIGGTTDAVKDGVNGLICKKKDAMSLASCIEKLVKSPGLRQEMGEAGYKIYQEYFTFRVFERRLAECLYASM